MNAEQVIEFYLKAETPEQKAILGRLLETLGVDPIDIDAEEARREEQEQQADYERIFPAQAQADRVKEAYIEWVEATRDYLQELNTNLIQSSFSELFPGEDEEEENKITQRYDEATDKLKNELGERTFSFTDPADKNKTLFINVAKVDERNERNEYALEKGNAKVLGSGHSWFEADFGNEMTIENMRMQPLDFKEVKNKGKAGSYLAYNHTTSYDFSDYQIYKYGEERQDDGIKEHCFVNSLMKQIPEDKEFIDRYRMLVGSQMFNVNGITKAIKGAPYRIVISKYDDDMKPTKKTTEKTTEKTTKKTYYGPKSGKEIRMILFRGHYMPDIPMKVPEKLEKGCKIFKRSNKNNTRKLTTILRNLVKEGKFVKTDKAIKRGFEMTDKELLSGNIAKDQKEFKMPKEKKMKIVESRSAGDFESIVRGVPHHVPFKLGIINKHGYTQFDATEKGLYDCNIFTNALRSIIKQFNPEHNIIREKELLEKKAFDKEEIAKLKENPDYIKAEYQETQFRHVIYFHNLKYDWTLIKQNKNICVFTEVNKDGQIFSIELGFRPDPEGYMYKFILKDSYKLIPMPLREFKKAFTLDSGKMDGFEMYELFTPKNFVFNHIDIHELQAYLNKQLPIIKETNLAKLTEAKKKLYVTRTQNKIDKMREEHQKFLLDMAADGYLVEDPHIGTIFYHNAYYDKYLKLDCVTLWEGLEAFDKIITQLTGGSVYDFLTISSLAHNYLITQGCYEGTVKIGGRLQEFLNKFAVGGRVMTQNNQKVYRKEIERIEYEEKNGQIVEKKIYKKIEDFDGVSLYPSAMSICKFIKGKCEVIPEGLTLDEINERYAEYFLKVNIKINKNLSFPTVSKIVDGVRHWSNDTTETYLDRIGLEDAMKFHKADFLGYECGVGFPKANGYNIEIQEVIKRLFNRRLQAKKEGNTGLSTVLKLMMNSSYGKTLMRDSDRKIVYVSQKKLESYIYNNYNKIISVEKINEKGFYNRVTLRNKWIGNFNSVHLGAAILSTSKRIMNRVLCAAEDIGATPFYTDTDSIHLWQEDVPRLAEYFKDTYEETLIGEDLCQFHTDFSSHINAKGLCSDEFIALGKKVYIDHLINDAGERAHHVRFKGANLSNIEAYCEANVLTLIEFYEKLKDGEKITLDLCEGKARFLFKENKVYTPEHLFKSFSF